MIDNRRVYNLDKEWKFHFGEVNDGELQSHSNSYNKCKAGGVVGPGGQQFPDSDWRVVNLPHDYLTETEFLPENLVSHGYKTRDNAWYRKTFRLDESLRGCHLLLDFEGIAVTAEVYFNGSLMGRSFSAYAPLAIDITDRAWFGDRLNTIAVHIDGLSTEGWWYEGAGIYRHVRLYAKNPVHFAHYGLFIKPLSPKPGYINSAPDASGGDEWSVECEVEIENSSYREESCSAEIELTDGGKVVGRGKLGANCPGDSIVTAKITIPVKSPKLWDIDTPVLYNAKAILKSDGKVIDTVSDTFGFRTVAVDKDQGLILNGKPFMMYGTCNHQDHAGVGTAVPDSVQYYRIERLKQLGTNAYRCSHNMPAKEILDACDRLGMVVMDENRRFETRPEVLCHLETMIKRDRNHPSVIMYSLFNEEPLQGNETGKRIYNRMKSRAVRLDDSRIITGAISGGYLDPEGCSDAMDMTGMNYRIFDWADFRRVFPDQPLYGSENNSAVTTRGCYKTDRESHVLSNFDEETVPWGQCIRETWDKLLSHPYVGGIFIWTGFDYRGEPTPFKWPSVSSQFGIMDTCGFPKDSFYINRAYFVKDPLVHIIGHWNHTNGDKVRIAAVSNQFETELFLNGKSLGRKRPDTKAYSHNNICEWTVDFEPGKLEAYAYDENGQLKAKDAAVTAGAPVKIVTEFSRSYIYNDGEDAVLANIHVADKDGNTVPNASDLIKFEWSDDLELLGVGNGDPNCHESDHMPERSLFAGYCQGIFAMKEKGKKAVIRVFADGLEGAEAVLEVRDRDGDEYIYPSLCDTVENFTVNSVSESKPDGACEIADNDMNSFERVDLSKGYLAGFTHGYVMYRVKMRVPHTKDGCKDRYLWVEGVTCEEAEFYVNGKLCMTLNESDNIKVNVLFEAPETEEAELRVVIKALNGRKSGLANRVSLRTSPGVEVCLTV